MGTDFSNPGPASTRTTTSAMTITTITTGTIMAVSVPTAFSYRYLAVPRPSAATRCDNLGNKIDVRVSVGTSTRFDTRIAGAKATTFGFPRIVPSIHVSRLL